VFFSVLAMAMIGAIIGWFTNYLAIKLLFRPLLPWVIPFTNISIQGLIPQRRKAIAAAIGKAVDEQLFSMEDIITRMLGNDQKREIVDIIRRKVVKQIRDRIPPLIPNGITKPLLSYLSGVIDKEAGDLLDNCFGQIILNASEKLDIRKMVEERLNSLDVTKVEELILPIAGRELKHIEVLGGILGFTIGLIQGILLNMDIF